MLFGKNATLSQDAIGQSDAFLAFQEQLSRVAAVDRPVLIVGERGTGKELAARRIHYLSRRWQEPLIELNCSALAPTLIEAELFGHEAGAFTGAAQRRRGRFEGADGGTLFLDELGNIPLEVQEKILRVVEYGAFERVGASESIRVDVRLVGATNADLPTLVEKGEFMPDLLDRLSFEVLYAPPLRARAEDILLLAGHFAARMAVELDQTEVPEFSREAQRQLLAYPWPGNVRELKNVVERAVYRAQTARITEITFDPFDSPWRLAADATPQPDPPAPIADQTPQHAFNLDYALPFSEIVQCLEKHLLQRAMHNASHNQRKAAASLGLSYHQFRGVYKKYRSA